jgi:hypothetical protein
MTTRSSLYAEKINSEHPIAIWTLDEQVDYVSLISETEREIYNASEWVLTNATASQEIPVPPDSPFLDSAVSRIVGNDVVLGPTGGNIELRSIYELPDNLFNATLANIAISFHLNIESSFAESVSFGYEYYDPTSTLTVEVLETTNVSSFITGEWYFFSNTFALPPSYAEDIKFLIRINVDDGGSAGAYDFLINGLTLGQWSEEFNRTSLGLTPTPLPSDIALDGLNMTITEAKSYGAGGLDAYYTSCSSDRLLYALNFGVPLVYGSQNVTKIYSHQHVINNETVTFPSLLFPGYGFLNERGKYNEYTAEFWLSVNTDSPEPQRIFGPISSTDGLYADNGFLTLVINKSYGSHYVGEWHRPMLIQIRFIRDGAVLLVNGEEVVSLTFLESSLVFPSEKDSQGRSQDWLGFYAYPNTTPFSIDTFAIYPYPVPTEVAKRRFVLGQGVIAPETKNAAFNGTTAFNDYAFTNYAVNYNYPDMYTWKQAFFDNISTSSNFLQLPEYQEPQIFLGGGKTKSEWLEDNKNKVLPTNTRTNLVLNPSIEVDTSGFRVASSTLARITTDSFIGSACLELTLTTTASNSGVLNLNNATYRFPYIAGETYTMSAYIKNSVGARNWRMDARGSVDATTTAVVQSDVGATVTNPTDWTRISNTFTFTDPSVTHFDFYIRGASGGAIGDKLLIDGILVEKTNTLGTYFDGSYNSVTPTNLVANNSWTGTANDSTSTLTTYQYQEDADGLPYYTFKPDSSWNSINSYFNFPSFGLLNSQVKTFFMTLRSDGNATGETLFRIVNSLTGDYFLAKLTNTTIVYSFSYSGTITQIAAKTIVAGELFTAGFNVDTLSSLPINGLNRFFSNQSVLNVFVGGDLGDAVNSLSTFSGSIYNIGFDGEYNSRKINNSSFDSVGIFETNTDLLFYTANYTYKVYDKYGFYFMDIAVASYWQDYVPLSYFGKYVEGTDNEIYYDLDNLQINLDYPEPLDVNSLETVSSWTYADLSSRYATPIQQDYNILDNSVYTGWDDYEDMSEDSQKYYYYNTEDSIVRSYISFQTIESGANNTLQDFLYKVVPRTKGVVDPDGLVDIPLPSSPPTILSNNWEDTAYEVVDGTVIYPPTKNQNNRLVDFNNLAIVYHLDIICDGIFHQPIRFRELQLASEVLERSNFTALGTKFGVPVYPYTTTGLYYNLKAKNAISTYKGSTPYLYLNNHSGWRIRGDFIPYIDRGVLMGVNPQRGIGTKVSAIQMWLRYSDINFPTQEIPIFSINHKNGTYVFYVEGDESGQRGKIIARDKQTSAILNNIQYHLNGRFVDTAYLVNEEWMVLGIAFTELLDYDQYFGNISINGPATYNNISYYLATNLQQIQQVQVRTWDDVDSQIWDYWENAFTWSQVRVISTTDIYDINPSDIYETYVGTDRTIFDDSQGGVLVDPDKVKIYGDFLWSTSTYTAV